MTLKQQVAEMIDDPRMAEQIISLIEKALPEKREIPEETSPDNMEYVNRDEGFNSYRAEILRKLRE